MSQAGHCHQLIWLILLTLGCFSAPVIHSTPAESPSNPKRVLPEQKKLTYRIYPDLITNLKRSEGRNQPSYIMLRIDLVAIHRKDVALLEQHQPLYLDSYLSFIHEHTKEDLNSPSKRANFLRASAKTIDRVLRVEIGRSVIQKMIIRRMVIE